MTSVFPAIRDLARRILAIEGARTNAGETPVDAAVRACAKLQVPLSQFMGCVGFYSLLSRALGLAKKEVPALQVVHVRPDGSLAGFDQIDRGQDAGEFENGRVALVAHLLNLLVTFIGASLALRIACDGWPDASIDKMDLKEEDSP